MTFMTTLPESDIVSDSELARDAAAGDRAALAGIYNRYAAPLHAYCVGLLRDRHAASDCVQDVFCIATAELPKLRNADKLRPWLYAIARRSALRALSERRREPAFDELPDNAATGPGPFTLTAQNELAQLVAQAAGGLSDRDRHALELDLPPRRDRNRPRRNSWASATTPPRNSNSGCATPSNAHWVRCWWPDALPRTDARSSPRTCPAGTNSSLS